MYLNVIPPPMQPSKSLLCRLFNVQCPKPLPQNPDALAALEQALMNNAQPQTFAPFQTGGVATLSGYRGMGCGGNCNCSCKQRRSGMGVFFR